MSTMNGIISTEHFKGFRQYEHGTTAVVEVLEDTCRAGTVTVLTRDHHAYRVPMSAITMEP